MKNIPPETPKIGNGLVQLLKMDRSTRQIWVNLADKLQLVFGPICYIVMVINMICDPTIQVRCKSFKTTHVFKSFVTFSNDYFLSI